MVTHEFFESAFEVDKFLNSRFKFIKVISITSNTSNDGYGNKITSYTVFYEEN